MSTNTATKKNAGRYTYQAKLTVQRFLESNIAKFNNPEMSYSDICREVYNVVSVEMSEESVKTLFKLACSSFGVKVKAKRPRRRKYTPQVIKTGSTSTGVTKISSLIQELMKQVQMLQETEAKLQAATSTAFTLPVVPSISNTTIDIK